MYEGNYSDILLPDIHYIMLKKEYYKFEDLIIGINDNKYLQDMTDRTYIFI
jgi:hypothetical protein